MKKKEILTYNEIKDFIDYITRFIYDINVCSDNIEQIITSVNERLNIRPIENFLKHYIQLSYSNISINAYKLFHKEEKRSFYKLFNKIKEFSYDNELKKHLENNSNQENNSYLVKNRKEFIILIDEMLKLIEEKDELISKFKNRRLKYYAHSDPSQNIIPETFDDVKELRDFLNDLFNIYFMRYELTSFLFKFNVASIKNVLEDRKRIDNCLKQIEDSL